MVRVWTCGNYSACHRARTSASWRFLLCFVLSLAPGDGEKCSEFLWFHPSSPTLWLLWITHDSPCGRPFHLPPRVPLQHAWDPQRPTTVIVPGRRSTTGTPRWVRTMAHELLDVGQENVLAADWLVPVDMELIEAAEQIGKKLAEAIQHLLVMGSTPDMFHLIGFGVGAHVAGIAGSRLNGTIRRITGLDPFAPAFSQANSSVHLDYTDGQYVDVIHTNFNPTEPMPALGFSKPLGHVDFYTGSGYQLPGCPQGLFKREHYLLCSHHRAWQIYISSVRRPCRHSAFPCPSLECFQHARCTQCCLPGLSTCPEMGYDITWLPTSRPLPFQPVTAVLMITSAPPYCVTPLLLELSVGGNVSLQAKLFVELKGNVSKSSTLLVSGPDMMEFAAHKIYRFMVSADTAGDFQTITLKFSTQRLLYFEWRKRRLWIHYLLLSYLPTDRRIAYQAWNLTAVENHRLVVALEKIMVYRETEHS